MTSELNEGNNRPTIIKSNLTISCVQFVKMKTYSDVDRELDIPVYEISSIHGLNRLIGYN